MMEHRRLLLRKSGEKSRRSSGGSLRYFPHRPNLADKLQRLVLLAPVYGKAVEALVDLLLKNLEG